MTSTRSDHALEYAPPLRWHQVKRYRRLLVIASIAIVAFLTAYVSKPWWLQLHYLYWQRQALNFTLPPDQVVFESDATEAAKLMASGPEYQLVEYYQEGIRITGQHAVGFHPMMGALGNWKSIIFVHRRFTPNGQERLLAASVSLWKNSDQSLTLIIGGYGEALATMKPKSRLNSNTVDGHMTPWFYYKLSLSPSDRLRLFAGQPDPSDRTRFTFAYEFNGQPGAVAGSIGMDQSFQLRVLSGPMVLESVYFDMGTPASATRPSKLMSGGH